MAADEEEPVDLQALTGRTLGGKYRLEGMIASGGFGAVFDAVQMPLGRQVAVKVNLHGHQPAMRARFKREADVLTRLRHPGIVQLLDYGEEVQPDFGPLFYMVQEYVAGESLKGLLQRTPKLPPAEAVAIADELLIALGEAHRLGIVHRDIKPGNLMLAAEPGGRRAIRLLDFGISKAQQVDDDLGTLTATGAFLGTPAYMAPEQCQDQAVGPATDIYAVGVLLFRMLAGELPFQAKNTWGYVSQHIEAPVPSLPDDVPPEFTAIITRAMAKKPEDRFVCAEDMRGALIAAVPELGTPRAATRPPSASLPPLPPPPPASSAPPGQSGTAPYGTGTAAFSGNAQLPSPLGDSLPMLAPTYGENTTGGPMVMERPPEGRPRWWMAALAIATIALATGLTALNVDDATDAEVPSRIQLSVSAQEPASADSTLAVRDASAPGDAEVADTPDAEALRDTSVKPNKTRTRRRRRPNRRSSAAKPKPAATTSTRQPLTTPKSKTPSADQVARTFDNAIVRCDCSKARTHLQSLRTLDAPLAAVKQRRYEEECQMRLPGNCRSR